MGLERIFRLLAEERAMAHAMEHQRLIANEHAAAMRQRAYSGSTHMLENHPRGTRRCNCVNCGAPFAYSDKECTYCGSNR